MILSEFRMGNLELRMVWMSIFLVVGCVLLGLFFHALNVRRMTGG